MREKTGVDYQIVFSYAGHYSEELPPVPVHSHRGTELVFVSRGACVTEFSNGVSLEGKQGTVYVTPPELVHVQKDLSPDCETIYCVMEFVGDAPDTSLRTIDASGDALIDQWFHNLLELNNSYEPEQASMLLHTIWLRLEQLEKHRLQQDSRHVGVARATEFLRRNYMKQFSVAELAEEIGMSQSHLNALFRAEFGTGVAAYLTALRMRHARRLLLNPCYNIAEVAERCGLPNPNYFVRRFHAYHGVTPGAYRKDPSNYADAIRTIPTMPELIK